MANEMRKTAIIVSVLAILVGAPSQSSATKEIEVTVGANSSVENPVGAGFPAGMGTAPWEGAEALLINIYAADPMDIASASVHLYEAVIWCPMDESAPDPWIFETVGILPDEAFAVIFKGNLKRSGAGAAGGRPPDWGAAVSDIDIDCDSDNDSSEEYPEPETGAGAEFEDAIEYVSGSNSTQPPGMAMSPTETWAQLRVTGHAKRSGFMSLQVGGDTSKFVIADSSLNPLTPPGDPKVSPEPGHTVVYEEEVDEARLLSGTFYVKAESDAEDGDEISVTAVFASGLVVDAGVASGRIVADVVLAKKVKWSLNKGLRVVMVEADGNYDAPGTGDPPYNPAGMKPLVVYGPPGKDFVLKRTFTTTTPRLRVFKSDGTTEVTFTDHQSDTFEMPGDGKETFWVKGLEAECVADAHNDASANREDQGIEVWLTEGNPTEAEVTSKWTALWVKLDLTVPKTQPVPGDKLAGAYIHTGVNGICETTAAEGDDQPIGWGLGRAKAKAITPGTNGTIETKAQPDDVKVGNEKIHTGDDGICDTDKEGDDEQRIPRWEGQKYQQCIRAVIGADNDAQPAIMLNYGGTSLGLIGEGSDSGMTHIGLMYAVQLEGDAYPKGLHSYKMRRQVIGCRANKQDEGPSTIFGVQRRDDDSRSEFLDETEGSMTGKIYDHDAPGIGGLRFGSPLLGGVTNDGIVAIRGNFVQWVEHLGERCSRKLPWFMRRAAEKDGELLDGIWSAVHVCEEDNKVGEGSTGLAFGGEPLMMTASLEGTPTPPKDEGDGTFTATFTAKVDGGEPPYKYYWYAENGTLKKLEPDEPNKRKGTFEPTKENHGKHKVTVTVTDSTECPTYNRDRVGVDVITNTSPVVTSVTHAFYKNGDLGVSAWIVDKEGHIVAAMCEVRFLNAAGQISKPKKKRALEDDDKKEKGVIWRFAVPANTETIEVRVDTIDNKSALGTEWIRFPK